MNKCNCKIENTILVGDELYQFLKNKQVIKIGNTLYAGPKIVKSEDGRHAFEIYEEINVYNTVLHDNLIEAQGKNYVCNHRLTRDEIDKKYFSMWETKDLADVQSGWNKSENPSAVRYRMWMLCAFLSELYKDKPNPRILIVSHANAIQDLTGIYLKNCEYCVVDSLEKLGPLFR